MSRSPPRAGPSRWAGGMAAAIDAHPWGEGPLGERHRWPGRLAGAVDALLCSVSPMACFWGRDGVALFNDAMAGRLPDAAARLGRTAREAWPDLAEAVDAVLDGGDAAEVGGVALRPLRGPGGAVLAVLAAAPARSEGEAAAPAAAWTADAGGRALELSPRWRALTGSPDGGTAGGGWRDAVHPEDLGRTLDLWAAAVASGRPYRVEHRIRTADGSYRWMRTAADLRPAPSGEARWYGASEPLDWRRVVENRQALLLGLADRFRAAADRPDIVDTATAALGRELGLGRVVYAEVDLARHEATVEAAWARSGPAPSGEALPLVALAFGRHAEVEAGRTVAVASEAAGAEAGLVVPLLRDGRLRALFRAVVEGPRAWLPEEVTLAEEVAARSWDALERVASAAVLRRNQARQSFLLVLGDRLREAVDAAEIAETTAEALAGHLHAAWAGYGEATPGADALAFAPGWSEAAAGAPPASVPFAALGPEHADDLARGLTTVFEAGEAPPLVRDLAAVVAVPLIRDGSLRGVLAVGHAAAHRWSAEEIALVGEVAARMWEALERARAEAALRDLNATLESRVEQRTAELRSSEARFRALFENAPAAIVLIRVGADGRAVFEAANAAAERAFGRRRGDLAGRGVAEAALPGDPLPQRALACAASGLPALYEARMTVGGETRTAESVLAPLAAGEDGVRRLIGISRDITAQRSAEEQLRQAQKMEAIGQLTGGIAHDFNNLLTGIIGSLALMQKRLGQGRTDALERYAGLALASANRAASLTHRLLAFSRRQPLEARPVDADALIASIGDLLRRTIGESIVLRIAGTPGLWPTLCDAHQLENALLNLAINARDAMPDGGHLTVETANAVLDSAYAAREPGVSPGPYVMVSVSDTGTGMAADVVARAFDPFFTTKPIGQGTGLGLSMIYGFVKQSDGHIKLYSEPGRGTTIKLFLPRFRGPGLSPGPGAPEEAGAALAEAGDAVLVVEDDDTVRGLVLDVLEDLGYAALQAVDGPAGLDVVRSGRRIDLLVTDVGLPGMNGRQFAEQVHALRPELKILFITGYAENAAFGSGHLAPGMQMMTKPFAVDALAKRIRSMIRDA